MNNALVVPRMRPLLFMIAVMPAAQAHAQFTVRSGAGANPAAVTPTRDQYRSDLGGGTTAGANGSFGGLRREVNWDGVPGALATPNNLPANFFNTTSPRGLVLTSPGSALQVSAAIGDASGQPTNFGNINPTYPAMFTVFSSQRLFTSIGSNVIDVNFDVPGTNIPATVTGFGCMFTDVDQASTTSLQFFDVAGASLGTVYAPVFSGGLSFVGSSTNSHSPPIARVRITLGNTAIGPNDNNTSSDIVVADDFIYGEPTDTIFRDGFN